ncbi:MAG: hypothetical protein KDA81_15255 [Planctomycetaceae bacterium]|nr:hypothetical protein [Planctomycetaceae bacterium]
MKTDKEVSAINSRAGWFITMNGSLTILALFQSLREDSVGWALYVWISAIQGAAIGLLAGALWSDRLLDRASPHREGGSLAGFAWSLLTYWGPIVATCIFGLILARTLPDAVRPKSSIAGNGGAALFQSLTIFFTAVSCTWLIVWIDSFKLMKRGKPSHETSLDA